MQSKDVPNTAAPSGSIAKALNVGLESGRRLVAALNQAIVANANKTISAKRSASERQGSCKVN
jgi:hypothetical protein